MMTKTHQSSCGTTAASVGSRHTLLGLILLLSVSLLIGCGHQFSDADTGSRASINTDSGYTRDYPPGTMDFRFWVHGPGGARRVGYVDFTHWAGQRESVIGAYSYGAPGGLEAALMNGTCPKARYAQHVLTLRSSSDDVDWRAALRGIPEKYIDHDYIVIFSDKKSKKVVGCGQLSTRNQGRVGG